MGETRGVISIVMLEMYEVPTTTQYLSTWADSETRQLSSFVPASIECQKSSSAPNEIDYAFKEEGIGYVLKIPSDVPTYEIVTRFYLNGNC